MGALPLAVVFSSWAQSGAIAPSDERLKGLFEARPAGAVRSCLDGCGDTATGFLLIPGDFVAGSTDAQGSTLGLSIWMDWGFLGLRLGLFPKAFLSLPSASSESSQKSLDL